MLIKQLDEPSFNLSKNDKEIIANDHSSLIKLIEILYMNKFFISEGLSFNEFKNVFIEGYGDFEYYTVKNFNKYLKSK